MRPLAAFLLLTTSCGPTAPLELTAVTFNTGTTEGLSHDSGPDDGYGSVQAASSDAYYGDGLAWTAVVEQTRAFFARAAPDVVALQEIFHSAECVDVPAEARAGFVCETWQPGEPTVAQVILGPGYQIACHRGKPDKCLAVRTAFGRFEGCDDPLCLDGLDGTAVPDCGRGARVGRGVIALDAGGTLTVVNVHGSSGLSDEDVACRVAQFRQVFVDLGDGRGPAANGERNLVLGDLNTDPVRLAGGDASADEFARHAGRGRKFSFISEVGEDATPTYGGLVNIDHVVSDQLDGTCISEGFSSIRYFDHVPVVCPVSE